MSYVWIEARALGSGDSRSAIKVLSPKLRADSEFR